jgi:class 3 adenylate cyclase
MSHSTSKLTIMFAKGTADLSMRFGLNSGPATGGVLRGEKARFQIFGDVSCTTQCCIRLRQNSHSAISFQTVNTAARMESNGQRDRIQVSQTTAELIMLAGKG